MVRRAEVFDWVDTRDSSHQHEYGEIADPYSPPFETFFVSLGNIILNLNNELDVPFVRVLGFLFWELSPCEFNASFLLTNKEEAVFVVDMRQTHLELWGIVNSFFASYQTCVMGHCSAGRMKFPVPGVASRGKIYRVVRKVIVLAARGRTGEVVSERTIDWSHRFTVRGHWRVLEGGKGKNRVGERVVDGFTWVSEHEKGPDGAPLIPKLRVVTGEAST